MKINLNWRSGKFVYPRGAELPVHYMPLQQFSLETAQTLSLIVALRMKRLAGEASLLDKYEVALWRETLLSDAVATLAAHGLRADDRVVDFGSYDGLLFEEVKRLCGSLSARPSYAVVMPDAQHTLKFGFVHSEDDWTYEVLPSGREIFKKNDVLVVNQASAIRDPKAIEPDWQALSSSADRVVLAIRACSGDTGCVRTTIHGRTIDVPAIDQVELALRRDGRPWHRRWLSHHDRDFFLPEDGRPDVGVVLASSFSGDGTPGFKAVCEKVC